MDGQAVFDYITSLQGALVVTAVLTPVTAVIIESINNRVMARVKVASWFPEAIPKQAAMMQHFGYSEEDCVFDTVLEAFSFLITFCGDHFLAGMLTLPVVVLGWEGAGAWGQVCLVTAGFMDLGLSIYDFIKKFLLCFFPTTFKRLGSPVPVPFFVSLAIMHHALSISLVIPMNMMYASLPAYHYLLCSLLFAAGICFLSGQYKLTLDISDRWQFSQFKKIVAGQAMIMWFTRAYVWVTQMRTALLYFREQGDMLFFYGGCVSGGLMSIFNFLMIADATMAAVKWLPLRMPENEQEREILCKRAKHSKFKMPFEVA